ncbi:MAG: DUF3572 domain-containing protein [Rhodobacteraceae bacterium]|nr:DUF3572 domain-containing protein [Paracoccaceae bacterium]
MPGQEYAETVGLKALAWLAGQEEMLGTFLAASGIGPGALRSRAAEPEFLGSVLDHILSNDGWVVGFCDATGLPYDAPMSARRALPGGAEVNWT